MKKLAKLFLLSLCSGFLFLGPTNAQDLAEKNSYIDEVNVKMDSEYYFGNLGKKDLNYNPDIYLKSPCTCGMNMLDFSIRVFLFGIKILLGIMLIILSFKTISLHKKLANTYKHNRLFCFPVINLYPLSEITIGKIRFFILILLLGFFIYNVYVYEIFSNNNLCCKNPVRQGYSGIIVGICSIIIFGVLLSKLSYLIKADNVMNKESHND